MQMNNKGFTLIELLATVILVGTVLTLLFSSFNLVKKEEINNTKNFNYNLEKLKFVREIENDLQNNELQNIILTDDNVNITFVFANGNTNLYIKDNILNYTNNENNTYTLEVKDLKFSPCLHFIYNYDNNKYYFKINIDLLNASTNIISDSVEVSYASKGKLKISSDYINKNIGICTN